MGFGFIKFIGQLLCQCLRAPLFFYMWLLLLLIPTVIGARLFILQWVQGLGVTGLTDQVSWGLYIANFTFLVGVAAAAVVLVVPAYIYRKKDMANLVIYGELLAITSIIMALLFITVDLGRPERVWHMLPLIGEFNFPTSIMAWDVVVLNGYLLLNIYICSYLCYAKYSGKKPATWQYMPLIILSMVAAVAIHTVTAFLFVGLVARPFWHEAIVAPRFLGSAFTAGPAILIIVFSVLQRLYQVKVQDSAIQLLRHIVTAALLLNLFLLACEAFKEFYGVTAHSHSAYYLFFGLHYNGEFYSNLVPWIWSAIIMEIIAAVILIIPPLAKRTRFLLTACVLANIGIWIEKGMGLVVPGFVPSPQGTIVEYMPTLHEILISIGIWTFGLMLFSLFVHMVTPVINGRLRHEVINAIDDWNPSTEVS